MEIAFRPVLTVRNMWFNVASQTRASYSRWGNFICYFLCSKIYLRNSQTPPIFSFLNSLVCPCIYFQEYKIDNLSFTCALNTYKKEHKNKRQKKKITDLQSRKRNVTHEASGKGPQEASGKMPHRRHAPRLHSIVHKRSGSETSSGGSENPGYTQLRGLGKNKRKQLKEARIKDVTMYLWSSHCKCVGGRVVENRLQPLWCSSACLWSCKPVNPHTSQKKG